MFNASNYSTIYVSQKTGSDLSSGVLPFDDDRSMGPVKNLSRALLMVQQFRDIGANQPITIKIMDDEFFVEKPIVLDEKFSALTIEPYKKTLISGGKKVENFKPDEFNGRKCLSADLSEMGDIEFTDLYVNGKRADFTKYPQEGSLRPESIEVESDELFDSSKWFIVKKEDMEKIKNFRNLGDCFISYNHFWVDEHTPIESYDEKERKIVFKYPSRFTIVNVDYIIENVAEEFKNPNEWYFDKPSKMLYYIPENDEIKPEEIRAYIPVTDKIFEIKGRPCKKVRNINIKGFEIAYTKGDYGSKQVGEHGEGNSEGIQYASDLQSVCAAHGSIEFCHASNCRLENCKLNCLGVHSIVIEEGSSRIFIRDNEITNSGAGAIRVNGGAYGSEQNVHTCRNIISGNKIKSCGRRYFAGCGILLMHTYENLVSHNEISDLYYTGISCGWVWGYGDNISRDNIIEYNHIHTIGQYKLSDMGAIYLLGGQPGTVVSNNVLHNIYSKTYGGNGIYTDEGSSCMTIENNICFDVGHNAYQQHYGRMNTVRNNIFVGMKTEPVRAYREEAHTGLIFDGNVIIANGTPIYKMGTDKDVSTGAVSVIESHNNILFDLKRDAPVVVRLKDKEFNLEQAQKLLGLEVGSTVCDTGFEKILGGKMPEKSKAYELGFKKIEN